MSESPNTDQRVQMLLSEMTLEEKIAQLSAVWVYEILDGVEFSEDKARRLLRNGIGQITRIGGASNLPPEQSAKLANRIQRFLQDETRLKIPAVVHEEACSGYMARGSTLFPQAIGVGSSWNQNLTRQMAQVIRQQMRSVGAHQALAPLLDITRDARWGRMEETFGEDPYLTGQLGMAFIRGLQADDWRDGIMATGKHFAGYGFSEGGMNWAPAHISQRELHEVVLWPFEAAVKEAGLASVMPAYHELDGIPVHADVGLLRKVLRDAWGFQGTTVSDYFAISMLEEYHHLAHNRRDAACRALVAGVDVELPNRDGYWNPLLEAVQDGTISIALLDEAVARVLRQKFALGLWEKPYVNEGHVPLAFESAQNEGIALQMARESLVLLKNDGQLLPLAKSGLKLAVIGPNAHSVRNLMGDYAYPCHIEALMEMRESGNVFSQPLPDSLTLDGVIGEMPTVLDAIQATVDAGTTINYQRGCGVSDVHRQEFEVAIEAARHADVAIVVVGDKAGLTLDCTTGESRDRSDLRLPGVQEELVQKIVETHTPVVIVLITGRPVTGDWIDAVPAVVEAWLPGGQGGRAIAEVLFGDYNPGGRLPVSYPRHVGQVPIYYNHKPSGGRSHWHGDYVEERSSPRFPFGHGLSYTQFAYDKTEVHVDWNATAAEFSAIQVTVHVNNIGCMRGDEVIQIYTHSLSAATTRPVKQLQAFSRITLDPGQGATVEARIPMQRFAYYHGEKWVVDVGDVEVMIGSSSDDIHAHHQVQIPATLQWEQLTQFTARVYVTK